VDRRAQRARRQQIRRRRTVVGSVGIVLVALIVVLVAAPGGWSVHSTTTTTTTRSTAASTGTAITTAGATRSGGPWSIEAGVEPWTLPVQLSRSSVVATGQGFSVLGGLTAAQASAATVYAVDPVAGRVLADGTLPNPVHDAAATTLGASTFVLGGGSPNTVATVQSIQTVADPVGTAAPTPARAGTVAGQLPAPRSDLAVARIGSTAYVVGGYDGTNYEPQVLATTDGTHYSSVADLTVPVRYPAVVAQNGLIYAFGGQTASAGSATTATDDVQVVDPSTRRSSVIAHLPQAMYGASAFVIGGTIYVAGGQVPGGDTLTTIYAFVPSAKKFLAAGLLPQAEAFGGYTTVGTGASSVGYIVGGEVAAQSGPDQAGIASGTLTSVLALRISPYGGPAGPAGAGAPYAGTLLIADRGNDRLLAMDTGRNLTWQYPSPAMPAPPGGFYFPDDAFFIHGGTGIISNQEDNHSIVQIGYPSGKILWQYGHPMSPGAAPGYLDQPDDAYLLKNGNVTVADASNNRILTISAAGQPLSQIGNGAYAHIPSTSVDYPNGDTPLANGDLLVSEINGSWIDEYTPTGTLVWSTQFPGVNYPSDPQELGPDLYLMTDYDPPAEGRVMTFTRAGKTPWVYDVLAGDGMLKKPSLAERLPNGLIMVNDDYRDRVVVIDPSTDSIVWQYGLTDQAGTTPGMLNTPDGFDNLLANGTTPTHPYTG